jgi:hypothetical protein
MTAPQPEAETCTTLVLDGKFSWPDGIVEVNGKKFMEDAKGNLIARDLVKPVDQLMDELVRKMIAYARDLSAQIGRFKGHCFDDLGGFQALIAQEYEASVGGAKGNVTLTSFDGCMKVQFQVADIIDFGAELQAAKKLIDECLAEWAAGSRDEIRAIVTRAFNVDKEGLVNRTELFMLTRVAIDDPRWQRAMAAIHDSIRIVGSKTHIRFYARPSREARWTGITVDLADA